MPLYARYAYVTLVDKVPKIIKMLKIRQEINRGSLRDLIAAIRYW
jgi:hypothetical protein